MKNVSILFENETFHILDRDEKDIKDYIKELSKVMESKNITIVEFSDDFIILRPSSVISIHVSQNDEANKRKNKKEDVISD